MSLKWIIFALTFSLLLSSIITAQETGTVTDIDGNKYQTVKIGDQLWMAENLRVIRYQNGDAIPTGLSDNAWQNTTSGAYVIYPHGNVDGINSEAGVVAVYGMLYNWYAVTDSRGLCPPGWHVPTDAEWTTLVNYLGGYAAAGGKMKSIRAEPDPHPRWKSPNIGATNESGFSGLPGGGRGVDSSYDATGGGGLWWSSTESSPKNAWYRFLNYNFSFVNRSSNDKRSGFSVRCLMDD